MASPALQDPAQIVRDHLDNARTCIRENGRVVNDQRLRRCYANELNGTADADGTVYPWKLSDRQKATFVRCSASEGNK
jgi:hypothetical protein